MLFLSPKQTNNILEQSVYLNFEHEPCWDPICYQYKLGYFMLKVTEKYNINWLKDERELLDQ